MNIVGSITVQVKYDSFKVIYTSLKVQYATNACCDGHWVTFKN